MTKNYHLLCLYILLLLPASLTDRHLSLLNGDDYGVLLLPFRYFIYLCSHRALFIPYLTVDM